MNKLPEQTELILKLKEAYKRKGLSLNKLIDMMPEDDRKLARSTVQRLFHSENSETKNYDYKTLIYLSNLLLDVDDDDDNALLLYKREVIEMLERENKDLRAQLVSCMKSITLQGLVSLLCMDPAGYLMWRNAKGI